MDSLTTAQHRFHAAVSVLPVPAEHKRNYSTHPIPGQMQMTFPQPPPAGGDDCECAEVGWCAACDERTAR